MTTENKRLNGIYEELEKLNAYEQVRIITEMIDLIFILFCTKIQEVPMKKKASAAKSKPAAKPAPKAAAKKAVKTKAVKSPAFKLGEEVVVITSHGKTCRLGKVIGIVPAGDGRLWGRLGNVRCLT